jgi:mono/diheme cytochrome c family protein
MRFPITAAFALVLGGMLLPSMVHAQAKAAAALHQYADADLALGEKLIRDNQCSACHARKLGGDGSAIYRPAGRINTPGALRGMVDYCSTELNLGLFPEEVTAVAAVLQRDHYRFPAQSPAPK